MIKVKTVTFLFGESCQDNRIVGPIPGDLEKADLRWDLDI